MTHLYRLKQLIPIANAHVGMLPVSFAFVSGTIVVGERRCVFTGDAVLLSQDCDQWSVTLMKTSSVCVQGGEAQKVTMTLLRPLDSTSPDFPPCMLQLTVYNLCLYLIYCNQPSLKKIAHQYWFH